MIFSICRLLLSKLCCAEAPSNFAATSARLAGHTSTPWLSSHRFESLLLLPTRRHQMSLDGPCSVLRGGMHSFPFASTAEGRANRDQQLQQRVHIQRHQHQQQQQQLYQPVASTVAVAAATTAAAFSLGSMAGSSGFRRPGSEKKENTQPAMTNDSNEQLGSTAVPATGSTGMVGGTPLSTALGNSNEYDADEPLPPMLTTPRLRSVSSLLVSSDAEDEALPLGDIRPSPCPPSRGRSREPSTWNSGIFDNINESLQGLPPPPRLPLSMDDQQQQQQQQRLRRDPSFPPLDAPAEGPRRLSRDPSFPPLDSDMSLVGTPSTSLPGCWSGSLSMSSTRINTNDHGASVSALGGNCGRAGGSGGIGSGGGGEARDMHIGNGGVEAGGTMTDAFAPFDGSEVHDPRHDRVLMDDYLLGGIGSGELPGEHRRRSSFPPAGAGGGTGSDDLLSPSSRNKSHNRVPSFDELAAMIPGIPFPFQPSSASRGSHHASSGRASAPVGGEIGNRRGGATTSPATFSPSIKPTTSTPEKPGRGRPSTRGKARPIRGLKREHTPGSGGRSGRGRNGRLEDVAGSAGPVSANGGPVDLARKARREQAIERYRYKRSRRKFANSTRDASPSRSRPKAAKIRPRLHGKFVKVVPDFIPVTAVSTEGGGSSGGSGSVGSGGLSNANMGEMGLGGYRAGSKAKGDGRGPVGGVSRDFGRRQQQQQRSFQQQHQQQQSSASVSQLDSGLRSDDISALWRTPPHM